MHEDPSTTLSSISAPWRLAMAGMGALGGIALLIGGILIHLVVDDAALTRAKVDGLVASVAHNTQEGINLSKLSDRMMEQAESNADKVQRIENALSVVKERCDVCKNKTDRLETELRREMEFCRGTVIPLIQTNRAEMLKRFKQIDPGR